MWCACLVTEFGGCKFDKDIRSGSVLARPENNSSISRNLGVAPENFLQKYGIQDTYDHPI